LKCLIFFIKEKVLFKFKNKNERAHFKIFKFIKDEYLNIFLQIYLFIFSGSIDHLFRFQRLTKDLKNNNTNLKNNLKIKRK